MGLLDGILGQLGSSSVGQALEQQAAAAIATRMGIDPSLAQMAITALTQNHPLPNDTVHASAQQTGISPDILGQIIGHLGGEGGLGQLAGALGGAAAPAAATPAAPAAPGGDIAGALTGILGGLMGGNRT